MHPWIHLPRIELHTHLDCAPSLRAIRSLRPETTGRDYLARFRAPPKCRDLAEFLSAIEAVLGLLQSGGALGLVARDLGQQLTVDGVAYAEVRFAPLLHGRAGLHPEAAVEAVLEGLKDAGLPIGLILCTLRHFSTEQGLQTLDLARRYQGQGVVALDLAGDEAGFPLDAHVPVFAAARAAGVPCIAHAGEAAGAESVLETLRQLQPCRIGHGVRAIEDPRAVEAVIAAGAHLEVCPSVNLQIGIFPDMASHSVARLRQAGVSVGINTDARLTAGTTLTQEYRALEAAFGWGRADFTDVNRAALAASFAPDGLKRRLDRQLSDTAVLAVP